MTIKKQYPSDKRKTVCEVTFLIDREAPQPTATAALLGDFNDWDRTAAPMKRRKDGAFSATLKLPCGKSYQFRYLMDGIVWANDQHADRYVRTPFGDSENCVIDV